MNHRPRSFSQPGHLQREATLCQQLAGAWIPALVFGTPGDSITAIVIGVLYLKNMNPDPSLFTTNPQNIYAVFLIFIVANIIMIPLGLLCIKVARRILKVPRNLLIPIILMFCVVGTFAINNSLFEVCVMLWLASWLMCWRRTGSRLHRPFLAWCWAACGKKTSSPP